MSKPYPARNCARELMTPLKTSSRLAELAAGPAIVCLLSACAAPGSGSGTAPTALPELGTTGPAAPTAVIENRYSIEGAILPTVRATSRTGTRADMRRSDALMTFDNRFLNAVAGGQRSADIVRVDRRLVWTLDPASRQYTECPITGCPTPAQKPDEARKPDQPAKPNEPDCPVTLRTNELKVLTSGERKTVNSFATERYQIQWTVDLEDRQGRRNSNKMLVDLWNTPETGAVREVQQLTENYERRYQSALNTGENPIGKYVPAQVLAAMSSIMKNIDPKDARTATAWSNELRKVRGYPILTTMTWNSDGSVCGDASGRASGGAAPSLGGIISGVMGRSATGAGAPGVPLVSFSNEVKTLAVRPVSDNLFVPPPDFQKR